MKIVEKWVAGFCLGELVVVKAKFRETEKQFAIVVDESPEYRRASKALNYMSVIPKDQDRLHDTWEEALDFLHSGQSRILKSHQRHIEMCQDRMDKIYNFELTSG
jgi:TolA-binding protein